MFNRASANLVFDEARRVSLLSNYYPPIFKASLFLLPFRPVLFEHEQNAESLSRQNSKYEIEARLCPQREERQEKLTVMKPA